MGATALGKALKALVACLNVMISHIGADAGQLAEDVLMIWADVDPSFEQYRAEGCHSPMYLEYNIGKEPDSPLLHGLNSRFPPPYGFLPDTPFSSRKSTVFPDSPLCTGTVL